MKNSQIWLIILHIQTNILNKINDQIYQLKKSASNSVYIGFIKLENSSQLAAKKIKTLLSMLLNPYGKITMLTKLMSGITPVLSTEMSQLANYILSVTSLHKVKPPLEQTNRGGKMKN
jgi:hypothetical protein